VIFEPGKKNVYFSTCPPPTLIHLFHRFTSESKPASIKVFWLLPQPFLHLQFNLFVISETFATQFWIALRDKHSLPWIGNISLWIPLALSPFTRKIMHNRTLLFGSILLMHGRHFDYWNQTLKMRMRVCYLDCHEAGLCCYLVIHIENLLRPLQLFYFHFWPIYWLSRTRFAETFDAAYSRVSGTVRLSVWRKSKQ
jgi:hypothetical protein